MPDAYTKKIKEKVSGNIVYPETKTSAVYLGNNITTLDTLLGDTSISSIGDGTITGAISSLNNDLSILGNTSISGIGNGTVTGAISTLNTKFDGVSFVGKNISANSTLTVTVPNNYRGIIFTCASPAGVMSIWGIMASSSGGVTARQIVAASSTNNITASAGTNTVTFTNPQSVGTTMLFINISANTIS